VHLSHNFDFKEKQKKVALVLRPLIVPETKILIGTGNPKGGEV